MGRWGAVVIEKKIEHYHARLQLILIWNESILKCYFVVAKLVKTLYACNETCTKVGVRGKGERRQCSYHKAAQRIHFCSSQVTENS